MATGELNTAFAYGECPGIRVMFMKRRRTDMGLVLVGLLLLAVGGYVLLSGEIWLSRLTVSEGQSMSGAGALIAGVVFVGLGLYFLYESRR
jgi:hypothetical protein